MKAWVNLGRVVGALVVCLLMGSAVHAAEFPEKPIQVLVGWPAGSLNDMVDRTIAQEYAAARPGGADDASSDAPVSL
jgi:tripartite-type tricarboxylate transporter receptor subunit TctC